MNMKRLAVKTKTNFRKLKNIKSYLNNTHYLNYVEKLSIDENAILLECQHGTNINGNIFYLLKELCETPKYSSFKKYVSVHKRYKAEVEKVLKAYSFSGYTLIERDSDEYYKKMASVKYLINDNTFLPFFIKKDGQVYLNTWHGTPLKTLGKKINNDFHNIGNTMKNFVVSDYLLYPNEYTKDHMVEDYMLENIADNKIVLNGYPRNTVFFDEQSRRRIREAEGITDKKIFAYMPTWRGTVAKKNKDEQIQEVLSYLSEIDKQLDEKSVLYVNFHPIIHSDIKFEDFHHIKSFPVGVETYEFLNVCDALITDYSSVFFDYAIRRNKIILFAYDKEEYFEDRGVYVPIEELPFPIVETVNDLIKELKSVKNYDDDEFIEKYCKYDNKDAASQLLDLLLFNKDEGLKIEKMPNNGKENVLIYGGNFMKNGITSSLVNLLENIDLNKRNYYVTFYSKKVVPYKDVIRALPEEIKYFPVAGKMNANISEKMLLKNYQKNKVSMKEAYPVLKKLYTYEIRRKYGAASFSHVINFTGYEFKMQLLFSFFEKAKKIIFVHSNMVQEIKVRGNQHEETLKYAYKNYDTIAIVTKDMFEPTKELAGTDNHFMVSSNVFDYKSVLEKAEKDIYFDDNTTCNIEFDEMVNIVTDPNKTKFINIGRFSPEKGHDRLLRAFDRIYEEHKDAYLIIIGGHGKEYENTMKLVDQLKSKDNIIIIKSMTNPFTILKYCQCFAFTSHYEGLGLVMLEADVLGVPVFTTNIPGPRGFVEKNGGTIVDNSEEGIYEGFQKYYRNEIVHMNVDYEKYNAKAVSEFENVLN